MADTGQLIEWLKALPRLQKVHYSWPIPILDVDGELLQEYARITQSLSVSARYVSAEEIDKAVQILAPYKTGRLALNYSPWHYKFDPNAPPTDVGQSHIDELVFMRENFERVAEDLADANAMYNAQVVVKALLFDSERFHTQPSPYGDWNAAITEKYDAAVAIAREIFPEASVYWYARGAVHEAATPTGWKENDHFTFGERGDGFSCTLYKVPEIGITRETFRRTVARAEAIRGEPVDVNPWVGLAAGYRRVVDAFHQYTKDWRYELIYSYMIGKELNYPWFGAEEQEQRYAPWRRARVVMFYPSPFVDSPKFGEHLVSYIRGAHRVKNLSDVQQSIC